METSKLRKFAQYARTALIEQVGVRLKSVLAEGNLARRENSKAVDELEKKIKELAGDDGEKIGRMRVIELAAYTWFNRFCALRFMDVNRYTKIGVISPADGQFQPEILAEAKMGYMDDDLIPKAVREKVNRLLDETDPSDDPQGEAYRLLLVAVCNNYHSLMPFMFEKIADYTELLLPDDLLSGNSIPAYTREALLPINCSPEHTDQSVEVIGWLYQFYIAEKKDEVFAALKKGKKITPENIPAATQLFTPHWIVRYLVENSLGRLWMLNHADSRLIEQMEYYIRPEKPETDVLRLASPEEIKICDPACGSGHMLTYAFDLLYAIYEEQGYQATDIPRLILKHNLFGVEIDDRAGALAAFALTMKAREKDRRFFNRKPIGEDSELSIENPKSKIQNPNICVLENIEIDPNDLSAYMDKVGRDLFSGGLQGVVNQWEEADNFGSLIRPLVTDVSEVLELLRERQIGGNLFLAGVHQKVLKALRQADYLSPKYHVVVANPPYATDKTLNPALQDQLETNTPEGESDLYAAFIVRCRGLCQPSAMFAMITMQGWMHQSTFPALRSILIRQTSLTSLLHLGAGAFEEISGEVVTVCAFVFTNVAKSEEAVFFGLTDAGRGDKKELAYRSALGNRGGSREFTIDPHEFEKLPDQIFGYWASPPMVECFEKYEPISETVALKAGISTGDNTLFQREWYECSLSRTSIPHLNDDYRESINEVRWYPCASGGPFRKWFGNHSTLIDWESDGVNIRNFTNDRGKMRGAIRNPETFFRFGLTWSKISSGTFAARIRPEGFLSDDTGRVGIVEQGSAYATLGFLCSSVANRFLQLVAPTLTFTSGDVGKLPWSRPNDQGQIEQLVEEAVKISVEDWNEAETSWDFVCSPLLASRSECVESVTAARSCQVNDRFSRLLDLEERNNRFFAIHYALENSFDFTAKADEISLRSFDLSDTIREFISYAVGCMLGRYSLDKPGLILANQGDSLREFFRLTILDFGLKREYDDSRLEECMEACTFAPDEDNVIPLLDKEWFEDDITERFKEFLKVTFGSEHYEENLTFLENTLYPDNENARKPKTIRDYFLKKFYNHHVKLYKKRPIYWLFSSKHTGGAGAFNALIYMHRYRPDTVSTVLQYLRDLRDKLSHRADHQQMVADSGGSTSSEKTKALKEVATLKKDIKELDEYERKDLFPLAQAKIVIDLDDGVKANYNKFGKALKKITGVTGKA